MKQGVTRPETPRDRREREALEEDLRGNPLAGAPLRQRVRNFRPDADAQLAALGGPLAWMRRPRGIQAAGAGHEGRAGGGVGRAPAPHPGGRARAPRGGRGGGGGGGPRGGPGGAGRGGGGGERGGGGIAGGETAMGGGNTRHYPAESRLPMNPRTGDFVLINGQPYTRKKLDAAWIRTRFPLDGQT